jgi:hypothetical protein
MKYQMKMKQPLDKIICESCGEEFSCGANVGECWCFDVEVKPETLAKLQEGSNNCLCQNCLVKVADGKFNLRNEKSFKDST